ncbi:unnamed protein product [Brassica oleracea var. botrytis]
MMKKKHRPFLLMLELKLVRVSLSKAELKSPTSCLWWSLRGSCCSLGISDLMRLCRETQDRAVDSTGRDQAREFCRDQACELRCNLFK